MIQKKVNKCLYLGSVFVAPIYVRKAYYAHVIDGFVICARALC
jgi:hypothetical protein